MQFTPCCGDASTALILLHHDLTMVGVYLLVYERVWLITWSSANLKRNARMSSQNMSLQRASLFSYSAIPNQCLLELSPSSPSCGYARLFQTRRSTPTFSALHRHIYSTQSILCIIPLLDVDRPDCALLQTDQQGPRRVAKVCVPLMSQGVHRTYPGMPVCMSHLAEGK